MSNNIHRVQNIFISDGTAMPANNAAITSLGAGDIGIYGSDWTALNPSGGDTITTQPSIYIVEGKTDSGGTFYVKKSMKIDGVNIIGYKAESYRPAIRTVAAIGYNRKTAAGLIEVNNDTNYNYIIRFKNDKWLYSERPEVLNVNFQSVVSATQLTIATQIAASITGSSFSRQITGVVVGNGTGLYGLTSATAYGVEIWALDVDQFYSSTYTPNQVYFSVHVNDASGFGTTTTCTVINAFAYGSGTYTQVYEMENKDFQYEGVLNRIKWPIPVLDYSSTSAYILSSAIVPTWAGTTGEDTVTFSATVAAILRVGEKVELDSVNYEIKYFVSTTVAVLTTPLLTTATTGAAKARLKYDLVNIDFTDSIITPTGVVARTNKSVIIAVPAIDAGGAYSTLSSSGTQVKAVLDAWMTTTPLAPANISI